MKKSLIRAEIYKLLAGIMMIGACYAKIIHEIVVTTEDEDPANYIEFYYSIYDKLSRNGFGYIVYVAIAFCIISILMNIVTLITKKEKIRKISEYVFLGAAFLFIYAFVWANLLRSQ